jgi:hypothetical protein
LHESVKDSEQDGDKGQRASVCYAVFTFAGKEMLYIDAPLNAYCYFINVHIFPELSD